MIVPVVLPITLCVISRLFCYGLCLHKPMSQQRQNNAWIVNRVGWVVFVHVCIFRWNWFTARNYCRKMCMDLVREIVFFLIYIYIILLFLHTSNPLKDTNFTIVFSLWYRLYCLVDSYSKQMSCAHSTCNHQRSLNCEYLKMVPYNILKFFLAVLHWRTQGIIFVFVWATGWMILCLPDHIRN